MILDTATSARPETSVSQTLDRRLLEAAARLFSDYGYAEISVDQIAAAAAAGKQSIYRRFPTKDALFRAAIEEFYVRPMTARWGHEVEAMQAMKVGDKAAIDVLRSMCRRVLDLVTQPDALTVYRLLIAEAWRFPEWASTISAGGAQWEALIVDQLDLAVAAGTIAECDRVETARVLVGLLTGWVLRHGLARGKPLTTTQIDHYFDCAWQIFLGGVQAQQAV